MSTRIEQTTPDVDDWIDGVSFTQAKVEIHRNPALLADLLPLHDRIAAAEQRLAELQSAAAGPSDAGDTTLGETGPGDDAPLAADATLADTRTLPQVVLDAQAELDALVEQADALYEQYDRDKEVWTLRALERSEVEEITEAVRADLEVGDAPVKKRSKESAKAFAQRRREWAKKHTEFVAETALRCLHAAVLSVTVAGVDKPRPALESLRRLRKRPHGERHYAELVTAVQRLTTEEVAVPAPHRRGA